MRLRASSTLPRPWPIASDNAVGQAFPSDVVRLAPDQGRQQFGRLVKTLLAKKRPSELELGRKRSLLLQRVRGKPFGKRMIRQAVGHLSRLGEDGWIHSFAGSLPEHRQLEEICRCAFSFAPQDLGELVVDLSAKEGGHFRPEDLSEQGMTETNARTWVTCVPDGNQSPPLEIYKDRVLGDLLRNVER